MSEFHLKLIMPKTYEQKYMSTSPINQGLQYTQWLLYHKYDYGEY